MTFKLFGWQRRSDWLYCAGLIFSLLLLTLYIVVPYTHTLTAGSNGIDANLGFYNAAVAFTRAVQSSPIAAFQQLLRSFAKDYNHLYVVPLLPLLLIFGTSKLVYVLALAICYLIPTNLLLGAIATCLIAGPPRAVFTSTLLLGMLTLPTWATILRGYPDIGGTMLICAAMWVSLLGNPKRQLIYPLPLRWQVPLLGVLLALAVLLRRHFAYAAVAVVAGWVIQAAIAFALQWRDPAIDRPTQWRHLLGFGIRLGLTLLTSIAVLLLLAWEFFYRALTVDYLTLYDSWSKPIGEVFTYYVQLYGWGSWLLVIAGFSIGLATRKLWPPAAVLVLSYGLLSIGVWLFKLRYTANYYALHLLPLVILGVAAAGWTLWLNGSQFRVKRWRSVAIGLFLLYWLVNAFLGIQVAGQQMQVSPFFSRSRLQRSNLDFAQLTELVNYLHQHSTNRQPIFVLHTLAVMPTTVIRADRQLYPQADQRLPVIQFHQNAVRDSSGYLPIEELLKAKLVVITKPFPESMLGQRDVIKAVFDLFEQPSEFAQDFRQLPARFVLRPETETVVYQRIRPTSIDRAVGLVHQLQTDLNEPLGGQLDWIVLGAPFGSRIDRLAVEQLANNQLAANQLAANQLAADQYQLRVAAFPGRPAPNATKPFLYVGALDQPLSVTAQVQLPPACRQVNLSLAAVSAEGIPIQPPQQVTFSQSAPLKLSIDPTDAAYLLLKIQNPNLAADAGDRCPITLENLAVLPP